MAGVFKLPNESVQIKYIKRQKGLITDSKHIAYGGLLEGAYITLPPKRLRNGTYANVLTNEEKAALEKLLALPENGLSIYNKENNYWDNVKIKLGKEGGFLELNDPEQYIKYKVILSYDDMVAPNLNSVDKKQTYRFVVVAKDDEAKQVMKKVDVTMEAYKLFGKLEDNREAMIDFLMTTGIKVSEDTSSDWLKGEIGKMITDNPTKFVTILKDKSYSTKVLLFKAIAKGEIVRKNGLFYSKDGDALAEPNQSATLDNTVSYLENNIYQEYTLNLMAKLK